MALPIHFHNQDSYGNMCRLCSVYSCYHHCNMTMIVNVQPLKSVIRLVVRLYTNTHDVRTTILCGIFEVLKLQIFSCTSQCRESLQQTYNMHNIINFVVFVYEFNGCYRN